MDSVNVIAETAELLVLDEPGQRVLKFTGPITVGRSTTNVVSLNDKNISRTHLNFFLCEEDSQYYVEVLGKGDKSCWINQQALNQGQKHVLKSGDYVVIGKAPHKKRPRATFLFRQLSSALSAATSLSMQQPAKDNGKDGRRPDVVQKPSLAASAAIATTGSAEAAATTISAEVAAAMDGAGALAKAMDAGRAVAEQAAEDLAEVGQEPADSAGAPAEARDAGQTALHPAAQDAAKVAEEQTGESQVAQDVALAQVEGAPTDADGAPGNVWVQEVDEGSSGDAVQAQRGAVAPAADEEAHAVQQTSFPESEDMTQVGEVIPSSCPSSIAPFASPSAALTVEDGGCTNQDAQQTPAPLNFCTDTASTTNGTALSLSSQLPVFGCADVKKDAKLCNLFDEAARKRLCDANAPNEEVGEVVQTAQDAHHAPRDAPMACEAVPRAAPQAAQEEALKILSPPEAEDTPKPGAGALGEALPAAEDAPIVDDVELVEVQNYASNYSRQGRSQERALRVARAKSVARSRSCARAKPRQRSPSLEWCTDVVPAKTWTCQCFCTNCLPSQFCGLCERPRPAPFPETEDMTKVSRAPSAVIGVEDGGLAKQSVQLTPSTPNLCSNALSTTHGSALPLFSSGSANVVKNVQLNELFHKAARRGLRGGHARAGDDEVGEVVQDAECSLVDAQMSSEAVPGAVPQEETHKTFERLIVELAEQGARELSQPQAEDASKTGALGEAILASKEVPLPAEDDAPKVDDAELAEVQKTACNMSWQDRAWLRAARPKSLARSKSAARAKPRQRSPSFVRTGARWTCQCSYVNLPPAEFCGGCERPKPVLIAPVPPPQVLAPPPQAVEQGSWDQERHRARSLSAAAPSSREEFQHGSRARSLGRAIPRSAGQFHDVSRARSLSSARGRKPDQSAIQCFAHRPVATPNRCEAAQPPRAPDEGADSDGSGGVCSKHDQQSSDCSWGDKLVQELLFLDGSANEWLQEVPAALAARILHAALSHRKGVHPSPSVVVGPVVVPPPVRPKVKIPVPHPAVPPKATQQSKAVPAKKRPATPSFTAAADDTGVSDNISVNKRSCYDWTYHQQPQLGAARTHLDPAYACGDAAGLMQEDITSLVLQCEQACTDADWGKVDAIMSRLKTLGVTCDETTGEWISTGGRKGVITSWDLSVPKPRYQR
eukprot:TRINITY_DN12182_c0_g1_i1.p1 TRINITY_DN12182_c0_g1~~TRINITY_DN12182_c0_g1_i1.p1  ORF type:complete len:1174 (+),score=224.36 TRINITY_DN12182_c0_g1_i1:71-3592(+)